MGDQVSGLHGRVDQMEGDLVCLSETTKTSDESKASTEASAEATGEMRAEQGMLRSVLSRVDALEAAANDVVRKTDRGARLFASLAQRVSALEEGVASTASSAPAPHSAGVQTEGLSQRLVNLEDLLAGTAASSSQHRRGGASRETVWLDHLREIPDRLSEIERQLQQVPKRKLVSAVAEEPGSSASPQRSKSNLKQLFEGDWSDQASAGGFYGGSVIRIMANEWRPMFPKSEAQKTATYSLVGLSAAALELTEARGDGSIRRFKLSLVDETTANVEMIDSPARLKWTLTKEKSYYEGKFALQDVLEERRNSQSLALLTERDAGGARRVYLCARRLSRSPKFEVLVGLIIALNVGLIGAEIDLHVRGVQTHPIFRPLELAFLAFYICELVLRIIVVCHECKFRKGFVHTVGHNKSLLFDFALVVLGVVSVTTAASNRWAMARMVRLSRLVQAARMMRGVESLWKLVRGLISSVTQLFPTLVMILVLLYVFACVGVVAIGDNAHIQKHEPSIAEDNFKGIARSMLTLFQFTTGDITPIVFPLVVAEPWLILYFSSAFLLIYVLLMNLVTAALVNDAITLGKNDNEMHDKKLKSQVDRFVPELHRIFKALDVGRDEQLSLEELIKGIDEVVDVPDEVREIFKLESLLDNYECFDSDGSGTVSLEEFVQGCLAVLTKQDTPVELTQALQLVRKNGRALERMVRKLDSIEGQVCCVPDRDGLEQREFNI